METLFACVLTFIITVAILRTRQKHINMRKIAFRQSILHKSLKPFMPTNAEYERSKKTQARERIKSSVVRVIQTPDSKAYWVDKNIFYCADVIDGQFDPTIGKPVDTNGLSKKEIDKLLLILDTLNKG